MKTFLRWLLALPVVLGCRSVAAEREAELSFRVAGFVKASGIT